MTLRSRTLVRAGAFASGILASLAAHASSTVLTLPGTDIVYSQPLTYTVTVTLDDNEDGNLQSSVVELYEGSTLLDSQVLGPMTGRTASVTVSNSAFASLGVGTHILKARFRADFDLWNVNASASQDVAQTVRKAATSTSISVASNVTFGQSAIVTATAAPQLPSDPTADRTGAFVYPSKIEFYLNNKKVGTVATDPATGVASFAMSGLKFGPNLIHAASVLDDRYTLSVSPKATVNAGYRRGDDVVANQTTGGNQLQPAIAGFAPGTGNALLVWTDKSGAKPAIMSRLIGPDGSFIANEVKVREAEGAENPTVTGFASGTFAVAWQEGPEGDRDIYICAINANGRTAQLPFRFNLTTDGDQTNPVLSSNGNDAAIAWQSKGEGTTGIDIIGRLTSSRSKEFTVNTTVKGDQTTPTLTWMSKSNFAIGWNGPDKTKKGLYLQVLDTKGAKVGAENLVFSQKALVPNMAMSWRGKVMTGPTAADVAVVAFDAREGAKTNRDIVGTVYDANGIKVAPLKAIIRATGDQASPTFTGLYGDAGAGAAVGNDGSGSGIYVQQVKLVQSVTDPLLAVQKPELANTTTAGSQYDPVIASIGKGNAQGKSFVVAWTSDDGDQGQNIRVQMFSTP